LKKPIIGIGADIAAQQGKRERVFAYVTYVDAIRRAGAIPLLVVPQPEEADRLAEVLDGILLAGGYDCDPLLYGEDPHETVEPMDHRRQDSDLALARLGRERNIPTLGICLGLQVINIAAGGNLIQDIRSHGTTSICHESDPGERTRHEVEVHPGTRLAAIVGAGTHEVNSSHHQAVRDPGLGLLEAAVAPDGIVEALEDPLHPFYVGVQWHPEDMTGEPSADRLFAAFLEAARVHGRNRAVLPVRELARMVAE
jgi:putative glutamine amidotransferase